MTMKDVPATDVLAQFSGFEGGIDDFSSAASDILTSLGVDEEGTANARVIRDYAQRGIVSRPERQGREAIYEYRQLVEFVAARILVRDGWPLAKIAEHFARLALSDIEALVPGRRPPSAALDVVRSLMSETDGRSKKMPRRMMSARIAALEPSPAAPDAGLLFGAMSAQLSRSKAELPSLLALLGADPTGPDLHDVAVLSIAPWLHVAIDRDRHSKLTQEDAATIARAIAASLMKTAPRGGKKHD